MPHPTYHSLLPILERAKGWNRNKTRPQDISRGRLLLLSHQAMVRGHRYRGEKDKLMAWGLLAWPSHKLGKGIQATHSGMDSFNQQLRFPDTSPLIYLADSRATDKQLLDLLKYP